MRRDKEPPCTLRVEEYLRGLDDFADRAMVVEGAGVNPNQASAALFHLRQRRAAGVIVEPDGKGWWYATPDTDDQSKKVLERSPERRPRNRKPGYRRNLRRQP